LPRGQAISRAAARRWLYLIEHATRMLRAGLRFVTRMLLRRGHPGWPQRDVIATAPVPV